MFEYFSDETAKYPFVHFNARIICTQNCLYRLSKRFRNLLLCRQKLDSIVRTNQVGRVLITATLARKFRAQRMDKGVEQSEETDQTCLFAYSGRTSKNLAIFVKLKRAGRKLQHLVFPCRERTNCARPRKPREIQRRICMCIQIETQKNSDRKLR